MDTNNVRFTLANVVLEPEYAWYGKAHGWADGARTTAFYQLELRGATEQVTLYASVLAGKAGVGEIPELAAIPELGDTPTIRKWLQPLRAGMSAQFTEGEDGVPRPYLVAGGETFEAPLTAVRAFVDFERWGYSIPRDMFVARFKLEAGSQVPVRDRKQGRILCNLADGADFLTESGKWRTEIVARRSQPEDYKAFVALPGAAKPSRPRVRLEDLAPLS